MHKIEKCLIDMYKSPDDYFYACIFSQIDRKTANIPTMGIGIKDGVIRLRYGVDFVNKHPEKAIKEVLIHEVFHLLNKHIFQNYTGLNLTKANIAQDAAINQLLDKTIIEELGGVTLKKIAEIAEMEEKDVLPNQNWTYYYSLIKDKGECDQNALDDHGEFGQQSEEEAERMKAEVKRVVSRAVNKSAGNIPGNIKELVNSILKAKIDWRAELRRFTVGSLKLDKTQTRSKRNRKYGILVPGSRKSNMSRILVVQDTSGSMSGERTQLAIAEMADMVKEFPGNEMDLCQADAVVQSVVKITGVDSFELNGGGGTDMSPAFRYAEKEGYDAIICISDMEYFEEPYRPSIPVLFVCTGNKEGKSNFAEVIHVE